MINSGILLIFSARQRMLSALYAIARPSVCPSVTRVDQSKRLKLGSCSFHHTVFQSLYFLGDKFHPEIPTESPPSGGVKQGLVWLFS